MRKWIEIIRHNPLVILRSLDSAMKERRLNAPSTWARSKRLRDLDVTFQCDECDFFAGTRQQVALHAFRVHGRRRTARRLIDTLYCPICMQMLHSREKVICHIEEKSARCRTVIMHKFTPLCPTIVAELDANDAMLGRALAKTGRRRNFTTEVALRMPGPLCREAFAVGISHSTLLRFPAATNLL